MFIRSFVIKLIAGALDHCLDWRLDALEQTVRSIDSTLAAIDGRLDDVYRVLADMDRTLDAVHSGLPESVDGDPPAADCRCGRPLPDSGAELCQGCWDQWVAQSATVPADSDGPMPWRDNG